MDIIFDLDGTLANLDHRLGFIKSKPKNWKAFFAGVSEDAPIGTMVALLKQLAEPEDNHILICSGRSQECEEATVNWLKHHGIVYNALYMRADGDYRDDSIVKKELLQQIFEDGYLPELVFDDRQRVVDMWREEGLTCCQVAKGDF